MLFSRNLVVLLLLLSFRLYSQHCKTVNPIEDFNSSEAPTSFSLEGYHWEIPWGYNKPENAARVYPLVIFTLRHEASQYFTTPIRQQYPAFFVTADCSTDAEASDFAAAVNSLRDTHNIRIDIKRIYVTGFSWGGACTFKFVRAFLKRGQAIAAVSRIAGDTETKYIPESLEKTAFWLHVGLQDTEKRIRTIRSIYDSIKNHPSNTDAIEIIIRDELNYSGTMVARSTKILSKNGDDIFKCSEYSQGHGAFAFYKDPGFFKWLFEREVCSVSSANIVKLNNEKDFILSQNYPNPFNPKTVISYKLKVKSDVKLIVYDILGREITVLVNDVKNAGNYTIKWTGENSSGQKVSSGVYFYRLKTASGFADIKKMILVK